jgi:hypothetical protein
MAGNLFKSVASAAVTTVQTKLSVYPKDGVYGPVTHNSMRFYGPQGKCDWDKVQIS